MKTKITLRLAVIMIIFAMILVVSQSYNLRQNGINDSLSEARAIAEVTKSGLTAHMVNGNMNQKNIFIKSLSEAKNIQKLWIVRGKNVIKQFGKDPQQLTIPRDNIDKQVLKTGQMQYEIDEHLSKTLLRVTIPYKATDSTSINCISCHHVKYGDTLGAVSVVLDISDLKSAGINNTMIIVTITIFALLVIVFFVIKLIIPYLEILETLNERFALAMNGSFKRIELDLFHRDEVKEIITKYNLLVDNLMKMFNEIDSKLRIFLNKNAKDKSSENPLIEVNDIITNLSYIYQFKKEIQLDLHKEDIYNRLGQIFLNKFNLKYVNILEINEMLKVSKVYSHGNLDFCTDKILSNPKDCRVYRNANDVHSVEFQKACPCFASDDYFYYCIDIEIGKASKLIFNFIFETEKELDQCKTELVNIKNYISETAPEIETRILFQALEETALRDTLTGLYNRRFLDEHTKTLIPQAIREKFNIGVLMLDMDHFKAVNDEYGHDIGDKILKEFARVVKENTRESDIVVRFGGEEFIVLLVGIKSEDDTIRIANKIREAVANNEVDVYAGSTMKKTVSIGVSMFPDDSSSFNSVLKFADLALYDAKDTGRNKVVRYVQNEKDALELF